MAKRNPNGYGCVKKLSGNRRRPWAVVVTTEYDAKPKDISFLEEALGKEKFAEVKELYEKHISEKIQGGQKQKPIGYYATEPEALIALADYNKNPFDIDRRNTTFGEIYEILYKEKFSKIENKSTRSSYTAPYAKCGSIKNIRMTELRKSHMQKIIDDHIDGSQSTQANLLKLFHVIYKFALENDICDKDYSQFVVKTAEQSEADPTPFTREEVKLLWDNLDTYDYMDSILIMIYTGMRNGEMRKLKKEDIHLEERYIDVKGTKTKAAKRVVPIHKKIAPLIEKRLAGPSDLLLPNLRNNVMSYESYRKKFDPIIDELGLLTELGEPHLPHDCRKTFSTFAEISKMSDFYVKAIMGHKNKDLRKDVYTRAFTEDLIKEMDKFEIK